MHFYTLHWQHTLSFLFFKPKGSRLANQAIVVYILKRQVINVYRIYTELKHVFITGEFVLVK